ncbi:hypothetical protein WME75_28055 [Sorangium sp. So ce1014]|uniref:hypothetical protein n=1 Tax=Sorangium sp. So ce1014 TaxID=3133326 RepID=UPI003F62D9CB
MGMTLLRVRIAALAVLAWGSACGGNVVVDGMPGGSGGAGATSTSTSAVGVGVTSTSASWMTTSAAVTSTGVGGGDVRSRCVDYCDLFLATCGQGPGDCGDFCDEQVSSAPECNGLLVPFFDCAMDEVFNCDAIPPRCQPLLDGYDACASDPACGALECFDGGGRACTCKGSCSGVDLAVECRPIGPGSISCSCLVNGAEVAACQDNGSACDLALGCCGPIFEQFR